MTWPTTFFAAQALVTAWTTEAINPEIEKNAIKFAVSSIEYICRDAANPVDCQEHYWSQSHSYHDIVYLVDDTKRRRRAAIEAVHPGPPEISLCRPPRRMTAMDGCQPR